MQCCSAQCSAFCCCLILVGVIVQAYYVPRSNKAAMRGSWLSRVFPSCCSAKRLHPKSCYYWCQIYHCWEGLLRFGIPILLSIAIEMKSQTLKDCLGSMCARSGERRKYTPTKNFAQNMEKSRGRKGLLIVRDPRCARNFMTELGYFRPAHQDQNGKHTARKTDHLQKKKR